MSTTLPKANLRWRLLRFENGKLQQKNHAQPLPEPLDYGEATQVQLPNAIAFIALGSQAHRRWFWGSPRHETYALLAGLPQGSAAANPSRWDTLMLKNLHIVWAGDYDGDGKGEIVLKDLGAGEESWLLQYRGDGWYGKRLSTSRRLVAVLPTRIKGQPRLVLMYEDKEIEIESLAIHHEK